MSTASRKKKIAILGGGPGGISTALHLTSKPGWQQEYEITVYQTGWRLGGKCASGRSLNPDTPDRIEEYGIHLLLGFYENVFHTMDRVYEEYEQPKDSPFRSWSDAVKGLTQMTAMSYEGGKWSGLSVNWPIDPTGRPGTPLQRSEVDLEHVHYLRYITESMRGRFRQVRPEHIEAPKWMPSGVLITKLLAFVLWLAHVILLAHPLRRKHRPVASEGIATLFRKFVELSAVHLLSKFGMWLLGGTREAIGKSVGLYDTVAMLDVSTALVRGMIEDDVIGQGFDVINGYDFREWLRNNGCTHTDFPIVRSGYDALFSYYGGDVNLPLMAAGVGLHGMLRMWFTYRGAVMYRMQAGMGDTIFSPSYEVLKKRGVSFEFFHVVRNLGVSADKGRIETIDIDVQATVKPEFQSVGYRPLYEVKGVRCWPDEPFYDQLEQGTELRERKIDLESAWTDWEPVARKKVVLGRDFDDVVLAIPVGVHPYICPELIQSNSRWRVMVEQTATVQTQALQLWLHRDSQSLGYDAGFPPVPEFEAPCATSYLEPFDTYVDMSDLIVREGWTPQDDVRQVAYFCCAIGDDLKAPPAFTPHPEFPRQQLERVRRGALEFLQNRIPWYDGRIDGIQAWWPAAIDEQGNFKWPLLVDRKNREGAARLEAQFFRINVDPSERYVLSLPATVRYRLAPDNSGFENLYLAGDWTKTIMNSGCVEAAIISGIVASFGISGYPTRILGALGQPIELKSHRAKSAEPTRAVGATAGAG